MQCIKKGTTTRALFVLKKLQKKRKRGKKKRKHQGKNISNGKQTCDEPQKPARAPKRQNTTTRGQPWQPSKLPTEQQYFFRFQFLKKIDQSNLKKKTQVYHWSRNSREFPELLIYWCCNTTLTNQALPCVVIGLNQLREAYRARLIPSEVTSKIAGSISVVNMIGLVD